MAKSKKSRPNLPEEALARARAELGQDPEPVKAKKKVSEKVAVDEPVAKRKVTSTTSYTQNVTIEELREEYAYVIADLRSMGILSGVLFAGLVVVALIVV